MVVEPGRERTNDSKLFNLMSDFRRNSTTWLRCFNENSVIDDNLKWVLTVDSNMPITLIFVTLSCGTNIEKVIFILLALIAIRPFEFSNCGDHTTNTIF